MQRLTTLALILAASTAHADNADDLKWKWGAVFQAHGDELASRVPSSDGGPLRDRLS